MEKNSYIRYGEAFKRQVVDQIENGKFSSVLGASRAYGIKGAATVTNWLRHYGREELLAKEITISTVKERDEKKQLKKRVSQLEKALADAHMKGLLNESYLEIACEDLDMDVEVFKKKHVSDLSSGPGKKESR